MLSRNKTNQETLRSRSFNVWSNFVFFLNCICGLKISETHFNQTTCKQDLNIFELIFFPGWFSFGEIDIFKLILPYMYTTNLLYLIFLFNTSTSVMRLFIDPQVHLIHSHSLAFAHVESPHEYLSWLFPNPIYLYFHLMSQGLHFRYSDLLLMFLSLVHLIGTFNVPIEVHI